MRTAYFDCFSGISGDMTVGALLDAGGSLEALREDLLRMLPGELAVSAREVRRFGLRGTKFDVHEAHHHPHHDHDDDHHGHANGDRHHDEVEHHHHRGLADCLELVDRGSFAPRAAERARRVFTRLAEAEAAVHGVSVEEVHFHEVGAVDSLADIVGACLLLEQLGVDRIEASPVVTGYGMVQCAHGQLPVPAPATAQLLKDIPTRAGHIEGEMATPTGAAILAALAERFGPPPEMNRKTLGWGAGGRELEGRPNLLRVIVGESVDGATSADRPPTEVTVIEANLDDATGELVGYLTERLFAAGARDVSVSAVQMKKNRPGVLVRVVADPGEAAALEELLLIESTSFGVRSYNARRRVLDREHREVQTEFGPVRLKVGRLGGRVVTVSPEFEDCRRLARQTGRPLKDILARAAAAGLHLTGSE